MGPLSVLGEVIAMIPNRDQLLVTGSDDEVGLGMMLDLAEKALNEEPRPLLGIPLRLDGEEWVDWRPPATHVHYPRFKLPALKFMAEAYAEQKKLLETLHEKTGQDIFVASYSAVRGEDGGLFSYCVWTGKVDSLLPQADKVMFDRDGNIVAEGSWEEVQEIAGQQMVPTEDYPLRFRVKEFPSREQLAAIGTTLA